MSWQSYLDTQLIASGCIKECAIIGFQGEFWAKSADFNLRPNENTNLVRNFSDPNLPRSSGVVVNGVKFMCIRADGNAVYGKKGADGVVTVKTNKCIIVGLYHEPIQPGQATNVVEKLGEYLRSAGY